VVKKIRRNRKGDGAFRHPSKIGMDKQDVCQVGQHPKSKSDFTSMLDVLWRTLTDDESHDGVRGRVHRITTGINTP